MAESTPQNPPRIVLLSCAGAPFSAELCGHLEKIRPDVLALIVAVVLSKPRIPAINRLPPGERVRTVLAQSGIRGLLAEMRLMVHYRLKNLWIKAQSLIHRLNGFKGRVRYKRIEDFCRERGIEPYVTRDINAAPAVAHLRALQPDLIVMATFHCILKASVITLASTAALNIHPSLLPHYRGADPINSVLRDGVRETGVTVHWVDEGIDTGDIVAQRGAMVPAGADEDCLRPLLAVIGAELLAGCVDDARLGRLARRPQSP